MKYLKELKIRPKENSVYSTEIMEKAYQNIMEEIIEHVIQGVCFEAHRAVILGYSEVHEHIIKQHESGIKCTNKEGEASKGENPPAYMPIPCVLCETVQNEISNGEEKPGPVGDIFGNDRKALRIMCPDCKGQKEASKLARHLLICGRTRTKDGNGKRIYLENEKDEKSSEGKKGNGSKSKKGNGSKKDKTVKTNDNMTPEQRQDYLMGRCGAITVKTGKPCMNPINCRLHKDKETVKQCISRSASIPDYLADCNIDADTVDP